MGRLARWLPLAGVVAVAVVLAAPTAAQIAPSVEIRIEPDTRPRTSSSELGAYYIATLTDRATGQPPNKTYSVFAQAKNAGGEETSASECVHAKDVDSRRLPGAYDCTVFVDHGGAWEFVVVVNEPRLDPRQPPVTVASGRVPFQLTTNQTLVKKTRELQTSAVAVVMLWVHVLITGGWFFCAGALALLAFPKLRRRISSFGLYALEQRLDLLVQLTWVSTAGVVGTGTYLLAKETAYKTPYHLSKLGAIFDLPYARPYFLTLGAKLALYVLMVPCLLPLVRGARRNLQNVGFGVASSASIYASRPSPPGGGATLLTAPKTEASSHVESSATRVGMFARLAIVVLPVGAIGISLLVTLLKYFHQLIEASNSIK